MRLRLKIERCNKPTLPLLWNTDGLRPNAEAGGPDASVADLLEQINEIVCLETDNHGLEDYAVEIDGYECMHWVSVWSVFKEEDEVTYVHQYIHYTVINQCPQCTIP
jgi:hypothetical protein